MCLKTGPCAFVILKYTNYSTRFTKQRTTGDLMKRILLFATCLMAFQFSQAKEVKGVKFADDIKVDKTTLKLNGVGIRKAYGVIDVYVAGLYVAEPTKDPEAILKTTTPKQLKMHFKRWVQKGQLQDAFKEGFQKNRDDGYKYNADLDKLGDTLKHMKENDEMTITFFTDHADIQIKDEKPVTIAGADFSKTLLKVFIVRPPDEDLKKGLLNL
jgi:hypothetical protein